MGTTFHLTAAAVGAALSCAAIAQPPKGEDGLSFRADPFFPVGDDFIAPNADPIRALRWWGSIADEVEPHNTDPLVPFDVRFYSSRGDEYPGQQLVRYDLSATETWTGIYCRGIEGLPGGGCEGPEPLYQYELCLPDDNPFIPEPGVEYWLVIHQRTDDEAHFWSWHEADVPHPFGRESVTWGFSGFEPGMINSCPFDYGGLIRQYDVAFELLTDCPTSCPADCDQNGTLNTLDFLCFLNLFSAGDPGADFNGDGTVNTLDFLAFLNAFNEGC